ncbi:nuclear transport factor 2-like protein [Hyalangium gracile]|uniref:nuclear transport factor 2 family protein n=1 Tax=Hyalangium gracile TaxID=394092 RepID=UPI001CCB27A0|nr:nuclear transport factor 2 family protein [Hyalangium gracile]
MSRAVLIAALGFSLFAGCGGPKSSPEGTVKSFYSTIESQDWLDLAEMVDADSLSKSGGPQRVAAFYYSIFQDVRDIDLTIEEALVQVPNQQAAVKFKCTATFRALGEMPYDRDCSDILPLRWRDGKWYIVVPGTGGLRPSL